VWAAAWVEKLEMGEKFLLHAKSLKKTKLDVRYVVTGCQPLFKIT